jgi:hypothetical protein
MANVQQQFGFQHIGYMPGYAPDMAPSRRMIQSSYASAIYFGDPVVKSASSPYVIPVTGAGTTATAILAGIFQGCWYTPKGGGAPQYSPWFPGSVQTDATALIIDSPGALFRAAALLTAVPATAVGNNIGWSTGAGGTTFGGGFSTYTVDQSTITTGPFAFTIVDMWSNRAIGNGADNTTNYNWVVVTFNNEAYRAGQTGVA